MIYDRDHKIRLLTSFMVIILCCCSNLLFLSGTSYESAYAEQSHKSEYTAKSNLRGVFIGEDPGALSTATVGRLALRLIENGTYRRVRIDHVFQTGDRFQFEISSNRDGWLYIFHRTKAHKPQLLWPRPNPAEKDNYLDSNEMRRGRSYVIPASPGVFVMDKEVGTEFFYVVITQEKKTPGLTTQGLGQVVKGVPNPFPQGPVEPNSNQIVQFGVRGTDDPVGRSSRGVIYDPGKDDNDKHIYFSPHPDDDRMKPMIKFQLRHE